MTDCDAARRSLLAYLDGELVGDERQAVEAHLQGCAACRRSYAAEEGLTAAIEAALPRPAAPEALRARVARLAERSGSRTRRYVTFAATLAAAVALLAIGIGRFRASEARRNDLVSVAIDSHLRYAGGRLPLEVRSEKTDDVSRFFEGRVPFHLTLPDYPVGPGEQKFYTLEGGRLVSLRDDYAAYVAYRMETRPISLLVASAARAQPSGRETVTSGRLTFHLDSVAGLNVITWVDNGLAYALVSDLSVNGDKSCLVCHGSPSERKKIPGFSAPRI